MMEEEDEEEEEEEGRNIDRNETTSSMFNKETENIHKRVQSNSDTFNI